MSTFLQLGHHCTCKPSDLMRQSSSEKSELVSELEPSFAFCLKLQLSDEARLKKPTQLLLGSDPPHSEALQS